MDTAAAATTTNFSDILKKSVISNFASDISISKMLISLGVAFGILEVRLHDKEGQFVNKLSELPGVKNAILISYSGNYVS